MMTTARSYDKSASAAEMGPGCIALAAEVKISFPLVTRVDFGSVKQQSYEVAMKTRLELLEILGRKDVTKVAAE